MPVKSRTTQKWGMNVVEKLKPALTHYRKALPHNKYLIRLFYKGVVSKWDKWFKTGGMVVDEGKSHCNCAPHIP